MITKTIPQSAQNSLVQIYGSSNDKKVLNAMISDVQKANQSIEIHTFSMSSRKLVQALIKKANEGVMVDIYIDEKNSSLVVSQTSHSKVKVHPVILSYTNKDRGYYHHKTLAIDGKVLWMGSGNFTNACFERQFNYFTRVQSKDFCKRVLSCFNKSTKKYMFRTKYENQIVEYWHLPSASDLTSIEARHNAKAIRRIKELILGAKKTIKVANAQFSSKTLAHHLMMASSKGVKVTFFYNGYDSDCVDRPNFIKMLNDFQSYGIKCVPNSKQTFMHEKNMLVDDKIFLNGSANWSSRAFKWNDESFLILHDLNQEQLRFIKNYWHESCEVGQ